MPSVGNFTAAKSLTLKAACIEFEYKPFNASKGVSDVSNSQYNKRYLSDDYPNFLKQQNIIFACIGKPNTENNLLKILNIKNKQFEQNLFNNFLKDQNIRAKQGKSFDIDSCNEVIKKSTNPKIKQKLNVVIDKINEANAPVKIHQPILKIKYDKSLTKDMYPKTPTFTRKIMAARGMGKTKFLIAFLHSLLNRGIVKHKNIYIFCPVMAY